MSMSRSGSRAGNEENEARDTPAGRPMGTGALGDVTVTGLGSVQGKAGGGVPTRNVANGDAANGDDRDKALESYVGVDSEKPRLDTQSNGDAANGNVANSNATNSNAANRNAANRNAANGNDRDKASESYVSVDSERPRLNTQSNSDAAKGNAANGNYRDKASESYVGVGSERPRPNTQSNGDAANGRDKASQLYVGVDSERPRLDTQSTSLRDQCYQTLKYYVQQIKPYFAKKFYPEDTLHGLAKTAENMVTELYYYRNCPREIALNLTMLTLFDLVVLVDDSISMMVMQKGERINTLKAVLKHIADVYSLARSEGIVALRFLNNDRGKRNITRGKVENALKGHKYLGVTRLGTELKRKVLRPFAVPDAMEKPLNIMIITDGTVEGEDEGLLQKNIMENVAKFKEQAEKEKYENPEDASDCVGYQFSRIGDDRDAVDFLKRLDDHPVLGPYVDALSGDATLEMLSQESADGKMTPLQWNVLSKLLLGGIMELWDNIDPAQTTTQIPSADDKGEEEEEEEFNDSDVEED